MDFLSRVEDIGGIDFVDVGASGGLDARWRCLEKGLNFVGFEPRADDCAVLEAKNWPYRSTRFLPYGIAGETGPATLYVTRSPHCTSLRKPNTPWLKRFSFHALFDVVETRTVDCVTLDHVVANDGLRGDILKMDIQGMEGPALDGAGALLDQLVCVELESGFNRNYINESVFWEINRQMEDAGFVMYDMVLHRIGRDNPKSQEGMRQPMWCQSLWMRDFVWTEPPKTARMAKAAILIASMFEFYDYAYELQSYCKEHGILTGDFIELE